MTDQAPNLEQQNLQAATENAQNFYGQSIGSLKSQVQNYREQLEQFSQQLPEDSQAQVQEMIDSYIELESSMDQAAQDVGVQDQMEQAAQQTQQQILAGNVRLAELDAQIVELNRRIELAGCV